MSRVALAGRRPRAWYDLFAHAVCWWTRSAYSHVELVIDGVCYSSSARRGVRSRRIYLERPHWDTVPAPWVDVAYALQLFAATRGDRYGWLDLIGQHVLRLPWHERRGWVCSEWVAEACRLANPRQWTPGGLMHYARFRDETDAD